jgi:hypothetical protein
MRKVSLEPYVGVQSGSCERYDDGSPSISPWIVRQQCARRLRRPVLAVHLDVGFAQM